MLLTGAGALIGKPLAGSLGSRANAKHLLQVGSLFRAALYVVPYLAHAAGHLSLTLLWLLGAFSGAAGAFVRPSVRVYLSLLSPDRSTLIQNTRTLTQCYTVAGLLGLAVGGTVVSAIGPPAAMAIDAATYILAAVSLCFATTPPDPPDATPAVLDKPHSSTGRLNASVRRALEIECIAALGLGLSSAAWSIHVTETLGVRPWQQGILLTFGGIASLLGARHVRSDLDGGAYWRLASATHTVGALLLSLVAIASPGGTAIVSFAIQSIVVSALASSRDVSLAAGRLLATPDHARPRT